MEIENINNTNIVRIASMRFETLFAEGKENQELTLRLKPAAGIQGFIILLQTPLPSID